MPIVSTNFSNQLLRLFPLTLTSCERNRELLVLPRPAPNWHNGQVNVFGKHVDVLLYIRATRQAGKMCSHRRLYLASASSAHCSSSPVSLILRCLRVSRSRVCCRSRRFQPKSKFLASSKVRR